MKPVLKALGTVLLKLGCDEALSHFAFKFNLRRYTEAQSVEAIRLVIRAGADTG